MHSQMGVLWSCCYSCNTSPFLLFSTPFHFSFHQLKEKVSRMRKSSRKTIICLSSSWSWTSYLWIFWYLIFPKEWSEWKNTGRLRKSLALYFEIILTFILLSVMFTIVIEVHLYTTWFVKVLQQWVNEI